MKILIVNSYYYPDMVGGAEHSVKKLAESLAKEHDVYVLCTSKRDSVEIINNVKVYRYNLPQVFYSNDFSKIKYKWKKILFKAIDSFNILAYSKIKKSISEIGPDIVHTNGLYGISGIVWKISKILEIPVLHTLRDYNLICPTINMIHRNGEICDGTHIICREYRRFNKLLSKNVEAVTAPSNSTLKTITDCGLFLESRKKVIYNAIDISEKEVCEMNLKFDMLNKKENLTTFVFLGSLEKHKGILWLLDVFSEIDNPFIKLRIAGRGSLESTIQDYSIRDKRIIYEGFCNEKEVSNILNTSDVLICPSLWKEPFGRVVIDAYKHGLPVIGTSLGGLKEIIKDKKTGVLITPLNDNELNEAIHYFYNMLFDINVFRENIIETLDQFTIDKQVDNFEYLYEKIRRPS